MLQMNPPTDCARHLPIVLVKVAYYASGSARFFAQIMLKLCSLFKIMLLF